MVVIQALKDKFIFLDTVTFIYYFQEEPRYIEFLNELFDRSSKKELTLFSSIISLSEILVKPLKDGNIDIAKNYFDILTNALFFDLKSIDPEIAFKASEIRAKQNLKTPDSLQLATFEHFKGDYFITNDKQLQRYDEKRILILDNIVN